MKQIKSEYSESSNLLKNQLEESKFEIEQLKLEINRLNKICAKNLSNNQQTVKGWIFKFLKIFEESYID